MLALSPFCRYYLYRGATDFRKGFDGLSGLVRSELGKDPVQGEVFIFLNGKRTQVKLLHFEGDGFSLYHKRLEQGTYELPRSAASQPSVPMSSQELMLLLQGIKLESVQRRKRYCHKKSS